MSTLSTLQVVVCDQDAGVRTRIQASLSEAGYDVLALGDAREALVSPAGANAGLMLLGEQPPGVECVDIMRAIKTEPALSGLFVVLMKACADDWCYNIADGHLLRDADPGELPKRVRGFLHYKALLHELRETANRFRDTGTAQSLDSLTEREIQVARLIALGYSTKECAAALGIRFKTAATHRANLMQKLGLRSIAQIVRFAIRTGLITP